ncbi:MAG: IreB family regulatory phosphoprotein [Turicibacter sp.]|nr:IreB family regulatory phosphoprotein [Turicibacter sp.]MDO5792846.1 IreB family regulatory phosphoprotein [Turicibacter sp.]
MISNHTMMLDDALQNKLNQNETVELILTDVFEALETKGYNPINQVVGYLISGDPAYISSYQGARNKIQQIERDEIIEVLLEKFVETKK